VAKNGRWPIPTSHLVLSPLGILTRRNFGLFPPNRVHAGDGCCGDHRGGNVRRWHSHVRSVDMWFGFFSLSPQLRRWYGSAFSPLWCDCRRSLHSTALHRDANRNSDGGISAVEQVIAIVNVDDVDVIGVKPVICPGPRPWVNETNPITLVLETRISTNHQERKPVDSEPMLRPKVSTVAIVRDAITAVAATLLPGAVV